MSPGVGLQIGTCRDKVVLNLGAVVTEMTPAEALDVAEALVAAAELAYIEQRASEEGA